MTDVDLLVVEQHAIHSFNSTVSSFSSLVVDETVSPRAANLVSSNLAGKHIAEGGKRIVQSLSS